MVYLFFLLCGDLFWTLVSLFFSDGGWDIRYIPLGIHLFFSFPVVLGWFGLGPIGELRGNRGTPVM
ncbi:hypothetical protein B0J11DRAFT_522728 [Dendryphion nanum]|uniref:Uncharacterized protein n=1 Tax=Dendryphion nanum TaxID=256645 RepID=A0A9P9IRY3_9PLEO|nr:hypothetical protein B0J11DRAFT_522728 [Dendryphion nanum]